MGSCAGSVMWWASLLIISELKTINSNVETFQGEMCLLGHTLGVKVEVVRPSCYDRDDYIGHYPDDGADNFDKVCLIEEDSRFGRRYCLAIDVE